MSTVTVLRPGFLIHLASRVQGGATYERHDQAPIVQGDTEIARWETTRRIDDKAEYDAAGNTRARARNLVASRLVKTAFGPILLLEDESAFDGAVAEAREMVSAFNASAHHSRIHFPLPLKGRIAESTAEAVSAIREETAALLGEMGKLAAFESIPDTASTDELAERVVALRDTANRARQLERLFEQESLCRTSLAEAIAVARKTAREITKRTVKAGESLGEVLKDLNLSPIATARRVFLDEPVSQVPEVGIVAPGGAEGDFLPIPLGRFADGDIPDTAGLVLEPPLVIVPDLSEEEHAAFERLFNGTTVVEYFAEHREIPDLEARVRVDLATFMENERKSAELEERLEALDPRVEIYDDPVPGDDPDPEAIARFHAEAEERLGLRRPEPGTESPSPAKEFIDALERALQEFGTYSFDDKGPDEVMDTPHLEAKIKALSPEDRERVFTGLEAHSERGAAFAEWLSIFTDTERDSKPSSTGTVVQLTNLKKLGARYPDLGLPHRAPEES